MRSLLARGIRYLGARNPQTLAELCMPPSDAGTLLSWLVWLVIAVLE